MLATQFTELVGCAVPIQLAGMGGLDDPRLPAEVATAGGLGMISLSGATPEQVATALEQVRALTQGVIGVNFIIPFYKGETALTLECIATAAARARVVEFFYSQPDSVLVEAVHAGGALACWQVGSRDEALSAARAGCDLVVAQGVEAGGHIRGRIGLFPLLAEVLDAVEVPVIAAGGIGSGRTMAAALAAGAAAVRLGTRFLAAQEAGIHPDYLNALIAARSEDTVFTVAFSGGWAAAGLGDAPHRVLASALAAAEAFEGDIVGETTFLPEGKVVRVGRFRASTPTAHTTGTIAAMSQWAGESVGSVTRVQPAGEIVRELATEAERLLRRWA